MCKILMYIWQVPQILLGILVVLIFWRKRGIVHKYKKTTVHWIHGQRWGISLGPIILLECMEISEDVVLEHVEELVKDKKVEKPTVDVSKFTSRFPGGQKNAENSADKNQCEECVAS